MRKLRWPVTVLAAAALVVAGCSSSKSSGGSATTAGSSGNGGTGSGGSQSEIKLGLIMPLSGSLVQQRLGFDAGAKARIAVENAKGGVNGRKITLKLQDDQGAAATNLSAAKTLVTNDNVLGILEAPVIEGAGAYLNGAGVPVVGWSSTPPYGQYKNYFGASGAFSTTRSASGSTTVQIVKKFGGTTVAIISHSDPQSTSAAVAFRTAAKKAGLKVGYTRLNYPHVPGDFTADAQALAAGHVDAAYVPVVTTVAAALYRAALQAGVKFKAYIFPDAINDAQAKQLGPDFNGVLSVATYRPLTSPSKGGAELQAALQKYGEPPKGAADVMVEAGWLSADIMIMGLKMAGPNPTRQKVIDSLRSVKSYDGDGLEAQPVNFAAFGTDAGLPRCQYVLQVKDGKSVLAQPDPICGKIGPVS